MDSHDQGMVNVRIGQKKRPMTTRKDVKRLTATHSGAFMLGKHGLNAKRERSGGQSDQDYAPTSAVTAGGKTRNHFASNNNFNQTQPLNLNV